MIENSKWLFETTSIHTIILNIISSVIFGVLIWSTRNIWLNKIINGYYLRFDAAKIYPNNKKSDKLINDAIKKSNSIRILAIRGKSFVDSDKSTCIYPAIWSDKNKTIEIIIANSTNSIINVRSIANNIDEEDYQLSIKMLCESIKIRKKSYSKLKLYTHNVELPFRIIILDKCMFLFYYPESGSVHTQNVIRYEKDSAAFYAFQKYYDSVKTISHEE